MGVFLPCYKITWDKKNINQRVAALKNTDRDRGKLKIHSKHLKETNQRESLIEIPKFAFFVFKAFRKSGSKSNYEIFD